MVGAIQAEMEVSWVKFEESISGLIRLLTLLLARTEESACPLPPLPPLLSSHTF
jgi:hypothetical protein